MPSCIDTVCASCLLSHAYRVDQATGNQGLLVQNSGKSLGEIWFFPCLWQALSIQFIYSCLNIICSRCCPTFAKEFPPGHECWNQSGSGPRSDGALVSGHNEPGSRAARRWNGHHVPRTTAAALCPAADYHPTSGRDDKQPHPAGHSTGHVCKSRGPADAWTAGQPKPLDAAKTTAGPGTAADHPPYYCTGLARSGSARDKHASAWFWCWGHGTATWSCWSAG